MSELARGENTTLTGRAAGLFDAHRQSILAHTDRLFAGLMIFQWIFGMALAQLVSPLTWRGTISETHVHIWAAVLLGGVIAILPVTLALCRPGSTSTRHVIAVAQMLFSALLIHLTGGRIETHFHVFGSLAFLAFYRDWKVLITATVIVAADHFLRGLYWPQSVYGVLTDSSWRWLEHAAWVLFEDSFLILSCRRSMEEMRRIAERQAQVEQGREELEDRIRERTAELAAANTDLSAEIGERRQAEAARDQALARFQAFMDNGPVFVALKDTTGRYVFVNKHFEQVMGITLKDIAGKRDRDLWGPEVVGLAERTDQEALVAEHPVQYSQCAIDAVGADRNLLVNKFALHDGSGETYIGALALDVTDLRAAENDLTRERAFLAVVLESTDVGILACDAEGRVTLTNRAARHLYGLGEGASADEGDPGAILFQPDGRTPLMHEETPLGRALRGEHIRNAEVVVVPHGDSSPRTLLAHGQPLMTDGGTCLGAVVALHDMTELKHMEDQFRQAQRMDAIGRLAGGVAHDFNNLLTIMLGQAQLLRAALEAQTPHHARIEEIIEAGQRAAGLTRQLLAFSRKQVMAPVVLNLNEALMQSLKMVHRLIGEDIDLVIAAAPQVGNVRVDPGQLEQIIVNLAINARDAMVSGGKLTFETADVELDETYLRQHPSMTPGRYVMLAVSDTGIGMDSTTQARIFEPFFTTKEVGKGTGLGLATVYGIVKQSGGFVWVYSEVGHGTTFKIYLPRAEADQMAAGTRSGGKDVLPGGSETVLVVEDEPKLRALVRDILVSYGYTVLEAGGGDEALGFARQFSGSIHLILTDVVMPGLSGREFIERITPHRPESRVIFMSGYTDDAIVRHGIVTDGIVFLQKPFTAETLLGKVREVLDSAKRAA